MGIPSRAQWVQLKKANNAKTGAVSGVNMGQLLEDYDKAFAARGHLGAVQEMTKLTAGAKKYYEAIKKKSPPFAQVFKTEVLDEIVRMQKVLDGLANPAAAFAAAMRKCIKAMSSLDEAMEKNDLDLFVSEHVRSVGVSLGRLAKIDAKAAEVKSLWDPLDVIKTDKPPRAVKILKAAIPLAAKVARQYDLLD